MTDQTIKVTKSPAQLAEDQKQANLDLASWYQKSAALKVLKDEEAVLRAKVVAFHFPDGLKEGTNNLEMPEGWKMVVKGSINRKVDTASIVAITEELRKLDPQFELSEFLKYKPELAITEYRKLVDMTTMTSGEAQEKAKLILKTFDQVLIITDGSPQVELVAPKKLKAKVSVS